jgi:hypothetical protein
MTAIALGEHIPHRDLRPTPDSLDRDVYWLTNIAITIFITAMVVFVMYLFDVPSWLATVILVAIVAFRLFWSRLFGG